MWSNVIIEGDVPQGRCKHAVVLANHDLYLYGGKSGPSYLKDFWKLELCAGRWTRLKAKNAPPPPPLQEHTMIYHKDHIYVFGGEIGIDDQTPLWICNLNKVEWRKWIGESKAKSPAGCRGHIAVVHSGYMLIHGGYRDLKGSLGDIWAFHFETESWHLFYRHMPPAWYNSFPAARHAHSGIMHAGGLFIYGGMSDLEEKADFWKFDLVEKRRKKRQTRNRTQSWSQLKIKPNPGHIVVASITKAFSSMFLYGGERNGKATNELWKFSFDNEVWEKITFHGVKPVPRIFPAVSMLPAIVKVKNTCVAEEEGSYWWDYTVGGGAEMKTTNHVNFNSVLKKLNGNYQVLKSQADEYGTDEPQDSDDEFMNQPKRSETTNCFRTASHGYQRVQKSNSVKFSDFQQLPNSTSDYSSMETLEEMNVRRRGFENPNYHGPLEECIEMETLSRVVQDPRIEITTPNYLLVVGGFETSNSHILNKPLVIWRLRVGKELLL